MTREELIQKIAEAISVVEGFASGKSRVAVENCNPGNIRRWSAGGKPYPTRNGYVDFCAWAGGDRARGLTEGWRVLRVLVGQYMSGAFHAGRSPSLYQMFETYAPATDRNSPKAYAEFVAKRIGTSPDIPLSEVVDDTRAVVS